jgi:hypothetical protein
MKKFFLSQIKSPEMYRKKKIFIDNQPIRYRNIKRSINSIDSIQQTNSNTELKYTASTFNYPITDSTYFKTTSNFSFSPILSTRTTKINFFDSKSPKSVKTKSKIAKKVKKTLETQTLQFNKKLRLFMNIDEDKTRNKKFMEMVNKNIEEMYFDYDSNNTKKKTILFSGNNAGILRNKIYFVKGVMDYMFPKLTIKKMHFLDEEKNKKFKQEMIRAHSEGQNDIYKKRIMSAKQIVSNSKYKYNGVFSTNNLRRQLLNKYKKIIVGGKKQLKLVHNYEFY